MPIYEYVCSKCGRFEVMQGINDKPLKANPECSDKSCPKKAERVVSASAFHLKGTGWYKTDYASGGSNTSGKKSGTDKSSEKSSETKSESSSTTTTEKKADGKKSGGGGSGGCGSGCGCH